MERNPASFRDRDGYVFVLEGEIYRKVHDSYAPHLQRLKSSGLLDQLVGKSLLIPHQELETAGDGSVVLKPDKVRLITYPYEWSFTQLKEAAVITLEVLTLALEKGMILKDGSAFNVQFRGCQPIFIDTLSFETYTEGQPWNGYKQFCEHFLSPLCLGKYLGAPYLGLWKLGVDGIPLSMTSTLLPVRSWFHLTPLLHIHLHQRAVSRYGRSGVTGEKHARRVIPKRNLLALVSNLREYISGLTLNTSKTTEWQHYESETHYSEEAKNSKEAIIRQWIGKVRPGVVWDIGANTGNYSRVALEAAGMVLSLDSDPMAIDRNFRLMKDLKTTSAYVLQADLLNPSPDMGWANKERPRLSVRSKPDLIMALGLIHHLVITNNVPFTMVATYLADLTDWLIVEFIPATDEKVLVLPQTSGKLLYQRDEFLKSFNDYFSVDDEVTISDSQRSLLLMKKR